MSCKKEMVKVMAKLRNEYPKYDFKRRKKIAGAIVYGKEK